ncbi:MAG: hypothetical protein ACRYE7_02280 [Janthinobacterium lividum]
MVIGLREVSISEEMRNERMHCIQKGILYAINDVSEIPESDLEKEDFTVIEETEFSSWFDTNQIPSHYYESFKFVTYAPKLFRYFRKSFNILEENYKNSFCDEPLKEISNPGASKSIFYITHDNKFIMKSVEGSENDCLLQLLSNYRKYILKHNQRSLLPKLSGFYRYESNEKKIKLLTMNNLKPSNINIYRKYDLKGSTYNRSVSTDGKSKRSVTFKDLDFKQKFDRGLFVKKNTLSALLQIIEKDCEFLKRHNIMDYSLLLIIYNIDDPNTLIKTTEIEAAEDRFKRLMHDSTTMNDIQLADENCASLTGSIPAESWSGDKFLLFVGIIDILQTYRFKKKVEYNTRSLLQPNISVQKPDVYASRLMEFLKKYVKLIFVSLLIR